MFLNSWSLALTLCSLLVLFLVIQASRTAIRVLRFWNPASDNSRQISLEQEIWLASTLINYTLGFQIFTLILFVLAADYYCQVIVGAMCATGALLANPFGMAALGIKVVGVFFYGFWIVLHQLDIRSESYPLVRIKYTYLLFLLPLIGLDITLQTLYIAGLKPDIITSCCAVVFGESQGDGRNLVAALDRRLLLPLFYGLTLFLAGTSLVLIKRWNRALAAITATAWLLFFLVSLTAVTTVFSSYIYAMPFHRCPFCIMKPEYNSIGFAIYGALIGAVFCGIAAPLTETVRSRAGLGEGVNRFQQQATRIALVLLLVFTTLSSFHLVRYLVTGGE